MDIFVYTYQCISLNIGVLYSAQIFVKQFHRYTTLNRFSEY